MKSQQLRIGPEHPPSWWREHTPDGGASSAAGTVAMKIVVYTPCQRCGSRMSGTNIVTGIEMCLCCGLTPGAGQPVTQCAPSRCPTHGKSTVIPSALDEKV